MDIVSIDIQTFEFVNRTMSNAVFDFILPLFRTPLFWAPLYFFILFFAIFNYGKRGYWFLVFIILTVSTSDLVSSRIVKPSIQRTRPCNIEYLDVIQRAPCGRSFSFTSTHATNHFAIAAFIIFTLGFNMPKIKAISWFWAAIISFSQIYVGVHFPLDILGGAALGILIGIVWSKIFLRYYRDTIVPS